MFTPEARKGMRMQAEASATLEATPVQTTYDRKHPYPAMVLVNRLLTGVGSEKETRHIELALGDSDIKHKVT